MATPVTRNVVSDRMAGQDPDPARTHAIDPQTLEAEAQTAAGIGVPVEDVRAWIESWDTPEELPMPVARKLA